MTIAKLVKDYQDQETLTYTLPYGNYTSVSFQSLTDSDNVITQESSENDNTSRIETFTAQSISYSVDLVPTSLAFLQTPTYAGDQARLGASFINQGNTPATKDIRSNYSVSCNGSGWQYLTDDGTPASALTPGNSVWEQTNAPVTMPNTTGNCAVQFCVDSNNQVAESNEGNNCLSIPFTLQPKPLPDLIVTATWLREGGSVKKDTRVHPYCTVQNIGSGSSPPFRLAYYINWDVYRDDDGVSGLCPGCSTTEHVKNDNIKLGDKGTRSLRCFVDYQGQVIESDETNNEMRVYFTVTK